MRSLFLIFLLLVTTSVFAENYLWIGPEAYHVDRTRQGGSSQDGWSAGARIGYDRIKDWGFYWGADALWSQGILRGRSGTDNAIKSRLTDISVEGRLGFTFSCCYVPSVILTPYVGYGAFQETNDFREPSPITAKFRIRYNYAAAGGLLYNQFTEKWGAGIHFKCRWMLDGKCHVTDDPDFDAMTMTIGTKPQYRIELPITYIPCSFPGFCLSPFYEFRQYGEHPNFPFDFMETKLRIWGINLKIIWNF